MTSRDCVNIVSKNLNSRRVGHAGTLDPLAQGVLVIAVGFATRLIEYVQEMEKSYRGTFRLGLESPSVDTETPATAINPDVVPTLEQLQAACQTQCGTISQQPPMYSAVKISGVRAFDLARRGVSVDMPARQVEVYSCEVLRYDFPDVELAVRCGSGTYIRSIGRDFASWLGTGAIMTELTREAVGPFRIADAVEIDAFRTATPFLESILPAVLAVNNIPNITVEPKILTELHQGKIVTISNSPDAQRIAIRDNFGTLRAIVKRLGDQWKSEKNFVE